MHPYLTRIRNHVPYAKAARRLPPYARLAVERDGRLFPSAALWASVAIVGVTVAAVAFMGVI